MTTTQTKTGADLIDSLPTDLYIDGRWQAASGGARYDVDDPSTGDLIASVADATADDGLAAVTAAYDALPAWRDTAPRQRAEILRRAFEMMPERSDEIAELIVRENGKSLADARGEDRRGVDISDPGRLTR
jgi:succinate-semialdehyde dehydrogenase/glutarate-semialdehyde dehydrogenase